MLSVTLAALIAWVCVNMYCTQTHSPDGERKGERHMHRTCPRICMRLWYSALCPFLPWLMVVCHFFACVCNRMYPAVRLAHSWTSFNADSPITRPYRPSSGRTCSFESETEFWAVTWYDASVLLARLCERQPSSAIDPSSNFLFFFFSLRCGDVLCMSGSIFSDQGSGIKQAACMFFWGA